MEEKIRTAVITGRHPYDLANFYAIFKNVPEIDFYPQHTEDFISDTGKSQIHYDVLVFYNFHQETPGNEQNWWDRGTKEVLGQLGETPQGIFLLHHAILAFPKWDMWSDICGIKDRKFSYYTDQIVKTEPNQKHPITSGLSSWEMIDETYVTNEPDDDSEVILYTDNPKSMKAIAWTRQYKNSRVLCYQSGHDNQSYSNENFRTVVSRGIQWLAGRI